MGVITGVLLLRAKEVITRVLPQHAREDITGVLLLHEREDTTGVPPHHVSLIITGVLLLPERTVTVGVLPLLHVIGMEAMTKEPQPK